MTLIEDKEFGKIELCTMLLPEGSILDSGTYTPSGRVLVSCMADTENGWRVFTANDDGTDICEVFDGVIEPKKTANGIRWMCFLDNKRVLLGDYILECEPDLDHCKASRLIPLEYPEEILKMPGLFCHWSEILISPDCEHICWTTLQISDSGCYLGKLVRDQEKYHLADVCLISSTEYFKPDPEHPGCVIPEPPRGGEVKQFVRGGRAISEAGAGKSITDGILQYLDSEEVVQITDTPGYEETTMFSPDETMGIVMSPRFSDRSNGAIFGLLPLPNSMAIRLLMNPLYMYAIAGVRAFRKGNIGPVLIDIGRSVKEGRNYAGVNLSDPEGEWVYCSPISWAVDSTKAMWVETTRLSEKKPKRRLRICRLMDRKPSSPVPVQKTPESAEIPYAKPIGTPMQRFEYPVKVAGKVSGMLTDTCHQEGDCLVAESAYDHYSDDGLSFTDGGFKVSTPANMFAGGKTVFEGDMTIRGEHNGEMKLHAVFERAGAAAPSMLLFDKGEDGIPASHGYAIYDGKTIRIEDMEP